MYHATTHAIRVSVETTFIDERSAPEDSQYFWAYTVEIANLGQESVQLRSRHWRITDSLGQTQEVQGPGVVGQEPVIEPGDTFSYTSGTPLNTSSGIMMGSYGMEGPNGEPFDIEIPAFSLDCPHVAQVVN